MLIRTLFFGTLFMLFISCANPVASLQPDIDRFLKEYPNNFGFVESNQRKVHYAWSGDATKRALIFVHGSPGSWQGWAHFLLDKDLQRNYHIIAIDRLGYGASGRGISETSLDKQAQAVLETLQSNLSSQKAILVGHSYGGPVIASAAMLEPQKIAGLVFVASSVSPELEKIKWFQYPATWLPIRLLIPSDLRVCNEEIFPLKSELSRKLPLWKNLKMPAVLIQGEEDELVPPGNLDFLLKHLDKKTVLKVRRERDLNHFVPWKRPDLIFDGIRTINKVL